MLHWGDGAAITREWSDKQSLLEFSAVVSRACRL